MTTLQVDIDTSDLKKQIQLYYRMRMATSVDFSTKELELLDGFGNFLDELLLTKED